jgi:hypothetical protein
MSDECHNDQVKPRSHATQAPGLPELMPALTPAPGVSERFGAGSHGLLRARLGYKPSMAKRPTPTAFQRGLVLLASKSSEPSLLLVQERIPDLVWWGGRGSWRGG